MIARSKAKRRRFVVSDASQSIYRGRDLRGWVSPSGRAWLAYDVDGRLLGGFPARLEAIAAVLRKADAP